MSEQRDTQGKEVESMYETPYDYLPIGLNTEVTIMNRLKLLIELPAEDMRTVIAHENVSSLGTPLTVNLSPVFISLKFAIEVKLR